MEDLSKRIKEAIATSKQIKITMLYGIGSDITIDFQPYIYGQDILQYEFVWGYIPFNRVFYKIHMDNVKSVLVTEITYTVLPDAIYLWSLQEEHFAVLVGFRNVYQQSSISSSDENKPPTQSES